MRSRKRTHTVVLTQQYETVYHRHEMRVVPTVFEERLVGI